MMVRQVNMIVSNAGHDDGVPTSILREISYLAYIQHPNIAKLEAIELKKETVQIVSEFCQFNLQEYIQKHYQCITPGLDDNHREPFLHNNDYHMPLKEIKTIAYQVLKGLSYLHHNGFVHRNLKSDNILVTDKPDLSVQITDFTLSRLTIIPHVQYTPEDPKERDRSGREARRLWYRAPQLLLRKQIYSMEVDMWSFGCLLGELITGDVLFNGDSQIEQLFQIFMLVGSPLTNDDWDSINDNEDYRISFPKWETLNFSHALKSRDSDDYQYIEKQMNPHRKIEFKRIKAMGMSVGQAGLDLLSQILRYNPNQRITAEDALKHRFFDDVRDSIEASVYKDTQKIQCFCENGQKYHKNTLPTCHLNQKLLFLLNCESTLAPSPTYFKTQPIINENMRMILVDWLIDVSVHFELMDETLHQCVSYLDRVLSRLVIDQTQLQLIGVTCMKIAEVFNERSKEYYQQENANEYAYITAGEYTAEQLIETEKQILFLLDLKLITPTIAHFIQIYTTLCNAPPQVFTHAIFLADLLLMNYGTLEYKTSNLALSCFYLSCQICDWNQTQNPFEANIKLIQNFVTFSEFESTTTYVQNYWTSYLNGANPMTFESIQNKYYSHHNIQVFSIPVPPISPTLVQNWLSK